MTGRTVTFWLEPLDTLFFRDGSSFDQNDAGMADARSLFPPQAHTVVGAVRAALARALGWSGRGPWSPEIIEKLGDGSDLGPLSFEGPYISQHNGEGSWTTWHPCPQHFTLTEKYGDFLVGSGSGVALKGDFFEIARPRSSSGRSPANLWVNQEAMDAILRGRTPHSFSQFRLGEIERSGAVDSAANRRARKAVLKEASYKSRLDTARRGGIAIWTREPRVGIARDRASRRVLDGMLYAASRIRLYPGYGLSMTVHGVSTTIELDRLPAAVPLGGDGGLAALRIMNASQRSILESRSEARSEDTLMLVLLTPADFGRHWPEIGKPLDAAVGGDRFGGEVADVLAVEGVTTGSWNGGGGAAARENRTYMPAGSVIFLNPGSAGSAPRAEQGAGRSTAFIGAPTSTRWGYGQVAVGTWKGL